MLTPIFSFESAKIKQISFHKSRHDLIAVALFSGALHVLNFLTRRVVLTLQITPKSLRALDFHPTQQFLATGGDDGALHLVDYLS